MAITYGEAIQRVAERTTENRHDIKRKNLQRRHSYTDVYGLEYTRVGGRDNPATIYISVSHDLDRYERYEFKLIMDKTNASDFRVKVADIDITAYLMAQQDGAWIDGEGIYPKKGLGEDGNYDLLEVAGDMYAEGREEDAETLLNTGYRKFEISSNSSFEVTMVLYLKHSHVNR